MPAFLEQFVHRLEQVRVEAKSAIGRILPIPQDPAEQAPQTTRFGQIIISAPNEPAEPVDELPLYAQGRDLSRPREALQMPIRAEPFTGINMRWVGQRSSARLAGTLLPSDLREILPVWRWQPRAGTPRFERSLCNRYR